VQQLDRELERARSELALTSEQAARIGAILKGGSAERVEQTGAGSALASGSTRPALEGETAARAM
jgi:hypothetical protein